MKTKLVYVLTCSPEATYIEQALMAVWSARYWNPDARIVLLTDDKTSEILHSGGLRSELLRYISEEIVISFEENKAMHYRSRWLKTMVRELVDGDVLFVDCDTICQKPLNDIDNCSAEIAMVPDEHMRVSDYPLDLKNTLSQNASILGYEVLQEEWYFNSGVIFAKDIEIVHRFWKQWHACWEEGERAGVGIDQVSLGKANLLCGHIIKHLDNVWNTLIYMSPIFAMNGKILHFWSFRNKSFMFCKPYLHYIRTHGLTDYAKDCILHPMRSVLPFDNELAVCKICDYFRESRRIKREIKKYKENVDSTLKDFPWNLRYSLVKKYLKINILRRGNLSSVYYS